jgi:hypothetical protein
MLLGLEKMLGLEQRGRESLPALRPGLKLEQESLECLR